MNKKEKERLEWAFEQLLREVIGGYMYIHNGSIDEFKTFVIVGNMGTYDISIKKR